MILTPAELEAIRRQAEGEYPSECCGVVLVRGEGEPSRRLRPCRNIQDRLHADDPQRFPRGSRTAYYMAPEDLLEISREEMQGWVVDVIYHSHIDAGAYFSETDRQNALVDGEPAYPGVAYVVVAVNRGRTGEAHAYRWQPAAREFVEVPMAENARLSPQNR